MCEHYSGRIEYLASVQQEENGLYNRETWEVVWEVHLEHGRKGGKGWLVHGSFVLGEKTGREISLAQNGIGFYCLTLIRGQMYVVETP